MSDVVDFLKRCAKSKKTVSLVYHGGSAPGEVREFVPKRVFNKQIRAFCLNDGYTKSFIIEKMEFVNPKTGELIAINQSSLKQLFKALPVYRYSIEEDDGDESEVDVVNISSDSGNKKGGCSVMSLWLFLLFFVIVVLVA